MGETLLDDFDVYVSCLPRWADEYVEGRWTLEQFEAHADAMRERLFTSEAERYAARYAGLVKMGLVAAARSPQP